MGNDDDQGGEAPCWAHLLDDLVRATSPPTVRSSNTIIYCDEWSDTTDFYRNALGLRPTMERDWFVEFELQPGAHLSVADARRATIPPGNGSGLTLSWRVDDIEATRAHLRAIGVEVSETRTRWGADCCFVSDPAGNRIEFWTATGDTEPTMRR